MPQVMQQNTPRFATTIVIAAGSLAALLFVFLPSSLYLANAKEFAAPPTHLALLLITFGLAATTLMSLPALLRLTRWQRGYATLLLATFLTAWLSSSFFVLDFGQLDGSSFELESHARNLFWHSAWLGLIFLAGIVIAWRNMRFVRTLAVLLGTGLLLSGLFNFYQAGNRLDADWRAVEPTSVARFDRSRNLLIVLMDTFQSDVLPVVLEQHPEVESQLRGFTFYPDNLGVAPSTYLTMPAFHSGIPYMNRKSVSEYYDVAVRDGSFFNQLADAGYQVDIVNPTVRCPSKTHSCEYQEKLLMHSWDAARTEASQLADLGLFRAAPGVSKSLFFDGTRGLVSGWLNPLPLAGLELRIFQGNTVLDLIGENISVDDAGPTAKLIHLLNTHPPYMFEQDCTFAGVQDRASRDWMTRQTTCAMRRFAQLLEDLRKVDVFDQTMIVLMADTGAGSVHGSADQSSLYARKHGVETGEWGRLIGGANPVLAIKYPGANDTFRHSDTAVQVTDLPRTICATLGDCSIEHGIDIRNDSVGTRQRSYIHYEWKNEYWGLSKIPGLVFYEVTGPLWEPGSWKRKMSSSLPAQVMNLEFSEQDNAQLFGLGWGEVESNEREISKRWSTSRESELYLPLPKNRDLVLEFQVLGAPGLDQLTMDVHVGGRSLGSRPLENRVQFVSFVLPAELIEDQVTHLTLQFSDLLIPENVDKRSLSAAFYGLNIYPDEKAAP
jgi:hypothetical protein